MTTTKPHPNPMAGILSVSQAADMLDASPLDVQRLIGIGALNDNRNTTGSVVMQKDLEAFMGRKCPGLIHLRKSHGWFATDHKLIDRNEFNRRIRRHATDLAEVSNAELESAFNANRRSRSYEFTIQPTPKMKDAFNADVTGSLIGSKATGLSVGVSAIASTLRSEALPIARKLQDRKSFSGPDPIEFLYSTPERFAAVLKGAMAKLSALDLPFVETKSVAFCGRPLTVKRRVAFSALSSDFNADIKRAVELAF
jgi:hypothetical protein